ncbi:hypothetical protein [Micromonospora sp. WMMD812]|uniref:hypothetical protein n=1 Tax=Micromonospora sp. WMMD812 TaxID=3015152 RepID=UPI00248CDB31|nr:hypothetical protein [Micromonospora sp. WMMD812]WBB65121.1 hypothetical protein O7603_18040 [Micromonospora sp. WMMD812]
METIDPNSDPHEASAGLKAVADAQRAVRDRPWPLWLYPANALVLGGLALTGLVESSMLAAFVVLVLGVALAALNYWAGHLMGTPFAVPTSRGFRILAALSGAFVIVSLFARAADLEWAIIVCVAGAAISYSLGSVLHYRSTHR